MQQKPRRSFFESLIWTKVDSTFVIITLNISQELCNTVANQIEWPFLNTSSTPFESLRVISVGNIQRPGIRL